MVKVEQARQTVLLKDQSKAEKVVQESLLLRNFIKILYKKEKK